MITFDTETCGLHGIAVLIQYCIDDDDVITHDIWLRPAQETIELVEMLATYKYGVCGFNLVFDWFHICKLHTIFSLLKDKTKRPIDCLDEIVELEPLARDGKCVKPVTACDLMLFAKKGPYQSLMDRKDVKIRKVPIQLAPKLCSHLNTTLKINPIYFARRSDPHNPWTVRQHKDKKTGEILDEFADVVLTFAPSSALKALYADVCKISTEEVTKFKDIQLTRELFPEELGYAPWALAVEDRRDHTGKRIYEKSWPAFIHWHIKHWKNNVLARKYAEDDVKYTRRLYKEFGSPVPGDKDSVLACAVGAIRWHGFNVDIKALKELRQEAIEAMEKVPIAGQRCRDYIFELLDPEERILVKNSTAKVALMNMSEWECDCECEGLVDTCHTCGGKGTYPHPVAERAKAVKKGREGKKEIELYDKIILAGRLHASLKIIGTLSGRMAGADKLNVQGIKSAKKVRACFSLAFSDMILAGGDFESFEVVIAVASYRDKNLEADLQTYGMCPECKGDGKLRIKHNDCKGKGCANCIKGMLTVPTLPCGDCEGAGQTKKKIHGLFGSSIYDMTYDEIVLTKGEEPDLYYQSKRGTFSQMYGGNENTLVDRLGISLESATSGAQRWAQRYPDVAKSQATITNQFQSMRQVGGLGTKIEWHEPSDKVESLLGFPRYFTLENMVTKSLFALAESPPKEWQNLKLNVVRKDRLQSVCGAARSAIFAAAFNIQSSNTRAAINHVIQSTGAEICKHTQAEIWTLQPSGVHDWNVMILNVHDELMTPCKKEIVGEVTKLVMQSVEKFKPIVPLLSIDWSERLETWADK